MKFRSGAFLLLLALLQLSVGASTPTPEPEITKEMAIKAATLFRNADPFSSDALGYAAILIRFTEKSPEVMIKVSHKPLPFLSSKKLSDKERAILIAAFVAGEMDSQLLHRKVKDDPYAGDLQLIETYRLMQQKKPRFVIPEIEQLIELEKAGELKRYLEAK